MLAIPLGVISGVAIMKVMDNGMKRVYIGDRSYLVRNYNNPKIEKKVGSELHKLTMKIEKLIRHLRKNFYSDERFKRLVDSYKGNIQEIDLKNEGEVGYNVGKGEVIGLCMTKEGNLLDVNTIMFVLLHELSHSMTIRYDHNERFWDNFEQVLNEALKIGIYTYEDFNSKPKMHCGMKISHAPQRK